MMLAYDLIVCSRQHHTWARSHLLSDEDLEAAEHSVIPLDERYSHSSSRIYTAQRSLRDAVVTPPRPCARTYTGSAFVHLREQRRHRWNSAQMLLHQYCSINALKSQ
jgi:hypothetical protein